MPSSASESIPYVLEFSRKCNPSLRTVLDVGMGFGKYGFLFREYYDVKAKQAYSPKDWRLHLTGVEIYKGYISQLQELIYNRIIIGDIFIILPTLKQFDLAIVSDVIEHFPKEKGYALLDNLLMHVTDIVVTTPLGFQKHAGSSENAHEEHKSGWMLEDFKKYTVLESHVVKRINKSEHVLIVYLRK